MGDVGQPPHTQRFWEAEEELRCCWATWDSLVKQKEFELLARTNIPYSLH